MKHLRLFTITGALALSLSAAIAQRPKCTLPPDTSGVRVLFPPDSSAANAVQAGGYALGNGVVFKPVGDGPDKVHMIHETAHTVQQRSSGGPLGGELVEMTGEMTMRIRKGGEETTCTLIVSVCHLAAAPRPDEGGETEVFEAEIIDFHAEVTDDPNFSLVRMTRVPHNGGEQGVDCGGLVRLVRQPDGNYACETCLPLQYQLDIQGTGPVWGGVNISEVVTENLSFTYGLSNGWHFEPFGNVAAARTASGVAVDNLGSSGQDGVRFRADARGLCPDESCRPSDDITAAGLSFDGLSLAAADAELMLTWGEPCLDLPKNCRDIALSLANPTGNAVDCQLHWGSLGAAATLVEVWNGDQLAGSQLVPAGSRACFFPQGSFVSGDGNSLTLRKRPGRTKYSNITLKRGAASSPAEVHFDTGTVLTGDTVHLVPMETTGSLPRAVCREMTLHGSETVPYCVCRPAWEMHGDSVTAGEGTSAAQLRSDYDLQAGPIFVLSPAMRVDCCDNDCDGIGDDFLPVNIMLEPVDVEHGGAGGGGRVTVRSYDSGGTETSSASYHGGGGGGGRISVNFTGNGASTCMVGVMNDGQLVGTASVPVNGETDVCFLGDGPDGPPLLTGCGKRRGIPGWEISCLVQDFDRDVQVTPVGATDPLVGDQILLLAEDPTPGVLEDTKSFEIETTNLTRLLICAILSGAAEETKKTIGDDELPVYQFPRGLEFVQSHPDYLELAPGNGLRFQGRIGDLQFLNSNGGSSTYAATMFLDLPGVGNAPYPLPGQLTLQEGPNNFTNENTQQYPVHLTDFLFELPPGDPDFSTLRVTGGTAQGLPCPGSVCVRAADDGRFTVDSFFDITYRIDYVMAGPFTGFSGSQTFQDNWQETAVTQPGGGVLGFPEGGALLSGDGDALTVDNLGSSGQDGVRLPLPQVSSFTITSDNFCPRVQSSQTGSLRFEEFGRANGLPNGSSLGSCAITRHTDSFFDIFVDFNPVSPSEVTVAVFDAGQHVASYTRAGGLQTFQCFPVSSGLPPVVEIGKLPALGSPPCKRIRWGDQVNIRVPGEPPVNGDEVRLLAHGVEFETVSSVVCNWTDCTATTLDELWMGVFGREISTRGALATDHNSSRSNKTSHVPISGGGGGGGTGSGLGDLLVRPTGGGEGDLWPMQVETGGISFGKTGARCVLEATGTIGGVPDQSYGTLALEKTGTGLRLSGDFSSRGTNTLRLMVFDDRVDRLRPVCEELVTPQLIADLDPGHVTILKACGAVPELIDPNQIECFYRLDFDGPVDVSTPAGESCTGTRVEVQLVNPLEHSQTLAQFRLGFELLQKLALKAIRNRHRNRGVPMSSRGSSHLRPSPTHYGSVSMTQLGSGIGSSAKDYYDGVRMDLGEAEGAVQQCAPVEVLSGNAAFGMTFSSRKGYDAYQARADMAAGRVTAQVHPENEGPLPHTAEATLVGVSNGQVTGKITLSGTGVLDMCGIGPDVAGDTSHLISYGRIPFAIQGSNYLCNPFQIIFDSPVRCTPDDGGPAFAATELLLSLCCDNDCDGIADNNRDDDCDGIICDNSLTARFANVPEVIITRTELRHFRNTSCFGAGGGRLQADDGTLSVTGISPSGNDGLHIEALNGGLAVFVFEPNEISAAALTRLSLHATHTGGDGGTLTFGPLAGGALPLAADFSALGTQQARVVVLSGGTVTGSFVSQASFLGTIDASTPLLMTACGKLRSFPVPGGIQPPCFFWETESPFSLSPPGGGAPLTGDELRVLAEGSSVSIDDLTGFDIRAGSATGGGEFILTEMPRGDFDAWLTEHFSLSELNALDDDSDGDGILNLDTDGDTLTLIEEYAQGRDPGTAESDGGGKPVMTAVRAPGGIEDVFYSYEVDPNAAVDIQLRTSPDLESWTDPAASPDYTVTLEEVTELPGGNLLYTWRVSGQPTGRRFHGHVTILK